ncbi:DUF4142 domain-containing protein [uncultured Caulobacter sp.]|uniref:DUF4142 domain-containing protein n=1 Tax=uncultured Caulobacter sp. TaxID=158749 RepID=UPI00261F50A6|nr:DUF4142 domain-containing protein [uncultured Caulobacter sp.]
MRTLIVAAALAWTTAAAAQSTSAQSTSTQSTSAQSTSAGSAASDAASPPAAPAFVMMAGQSDAFEIQSGQMAADKASRPDLRAFGQRMVKDHTASTQMVMAAARKSGLSSAPPPALRADQQAMLSQLQGADGSAFDTLYVSQQLRAHQEALALHGAYARNGDDENLRKAAGKIVPVVTMHLDMLRKGDGGMSGSMSH